MSENSELSGLGWFFGGTEDEFAGVANSAFRWMATRDQARYDAQWRTEQARHAAEVARAYGETSAAQVAITQANQSRTTIIIMAVLAVVVLFRIRPTAND